MTSAALAPAADAPVLGQLLRFARLVRDNGFPIGIRESLDALAFAGGGDIMDARALRWGLKSLFCASPDDWRRFDELFDAYWHGRGVRQAVRIHGAPPRAGDRQITAGAAAALGPPDRVERDAGGAAAGEDGEARGASAAEGLARTDFRFLEGEEELAAVYDLAERLAARMRWRLSRRRRIANRGRVIDLRNTIHRSLKYGGVPLSLAFRRRKPRPVKLVVLLDASGSMSLYTTFFLRFVRGIVENFREAEAFVFHTRLVHLSQALREKNLERAMERMSVMSAGWGGGTRIGQCLATFNAHHAKSVLNSRSVVMILSDGYDTGAPELLGAEMARLRRRARRVIWLNPLIGWRDYAPVARGMAAALPHVDLFAPAHNLESLAALEPYLCRL